MDVEIVLLQDKTSPTKKVWGVVSGGGMAWSFYGPGTQRGGSIHEVTGKSWRSVVNTKLRKRYQSLFQGVINTKIEGDTAVRLRETAERLHASFWMNDGYDSAALDYIRLLQKKSETAPSPAPKTLAQIVESIDWKSLYPGPSWGF